VSQNDMNPENKCSHLFKNYITAQDKLKDPFQDLFNMQLTLQKFLASRGRGVDYSTETYLHKINDITVQWRNLTLEFAELLERLPFKEWKTYTDDQLSGNKMTEEEQLEIWYEYADMFHFFMNIGLALGIDGNILERLYVTKNKENFDRQKRGY
jgi:dimeric dUTPase (all-alpha-NTP-PPase superfamily)